MEKTNFTNLFGGITSHLRLVFVGLFALAATSLSAYGEGPSTWGPLSSGFKASLEAESTSEKNSMDKWVEENVTAMVIMINPPLVACEGEMLIFTFKL